jgi:multisubunit Na+/H+ antiporter MnhB subunit
MNAFAVGVALAVSVILLVVSMRLVIGLPYHERKEQSIGWIVILLGVAFLLLRKIHHFFPI